MKNMDSVNKTPHSRPNPGPQIIPQTNYQPKTQATAPNSVSLMARPRSGRRWLKLAFGLVIMVTLILGTVAISRATNLGNKIFVGNKITIFNIFRSVFGGNESSLEGEDRGQINILLLGIGGEGHDGPYLSDTMIVAQIRTSTSEVALTSIPRDLLTELPKNLGSRKINAAFAEGFGKNKDWNEGGKWAISAAEKISGLHIPYFAVIDFTGFEKAVDRVSGVNVVVDRTFTDYSFPNDKTLGYLPPVTFTQGPAHLNGKNALIFARSRHAAGPEGSDFARGIRQQKVIQAVKDKVFSLNLISDAGTINSLLDIFADHFHTNLQPSEMLKIYKLLRDKGIHSFISTSLDPETNLICPKILEESGAFVLVPCAGKTAADIKNFFQNAFSLGRLREEKPVIWMNNSTTNPKLYRDADKKLKEAGLQVWEVANTSEDPALEKNVFFQVNPKPATAEFLKNTLNAQEQTLPPPGIKIDRNKVDVIVILGEGKN